MISTGPMDYKVCFAPSFEMTPLTEGVQLYLNLSTAKELKVPRKEWSDPSLGEGLIWAAGGGAYLLGSRYLLLVERDALAPSNPGKLTVSTGLSDSEEEWKNPTLLLRELLEEILIFDRDEVILPQVDLKVSPPPSRIMVETLHHLGLRNHKLRMEKAQVLPLGKDKIILQCGAEKYEYQGIIDINKESRMVNYMALIDFPQFKDPFKLSFRDGELFKGRPLHRNIFLLDVKNDVLYSPEGKEVDPIPLTHHAQKLVNVLKI